MCEIAIQQNPKYGLTALPSMARKRKRGPTHHEDDEQAVDPSSSKHDLPKPTQEGAHSYMDKSELPWDLEPYAIRIFNAPTGDVCLKADTLT